MAYLEMIGIEKFFPGTPVLSDFSLSIQKGEFVSLVGPSGCGKTTTLRLLAGLERPQGGTIHLQGNTITEWPPHRRQISMVFQSYALFPNLNVFGNVAFGLWARKVDRVSTEQTVSKLLNMMGLQGMETRFPHELSGGQQQRVALARALAPEPKVLLLDEPLSAVDAIVRLRLRDELKRIQRDVGITTVMVTHDQEEALAISDRVVVMNNGKIEQVGTPVEIYRNPVNYFVAQFIGLSNVLQVERQGSLPEFFFQGHPIHFPFLSKNGKRDLVLHIRPEAIKLHKKEQSKVTESNVLPGRIRWRTFFGAVTRFEVIVGRESVLWVDIPGNEADHWAEGDEVFASFPISEVRVIDEGG